jgi:VTC domain.
MLEVGAKPQLRHELKYEVNLLEYKIAEKKLAGILQPDPHMKGQSSYNVRSLYFDDINNSSLGDKEAGVYQRKKYRMRIYNHSDEFIKFERKNRIGYYMLKESTRITREQADRIIGCDFEFLAKSDNQLLSEFYWETRCNLMRPAVIVEYDREAYIHQVGTVRITFDTQLRTSLGYKQFFCRDYCSMRALEQRDIILEVKYNDVLPGYISGLFPNTIRPQLAVGKYVICRNQQIGQVGVE